jgi:asparagine synthase (glutamine-hydrolysing)
MCGIAGIWSVRPVDSARLMARMLASIAHRGPDGNGVTDLGVGAPVFGHLRLAIVDLSEAGRQPMRSASGRLTIVLNGEVYNHAALRRELATSAGGAPAWRGHSDTETLVEAIERWGLVKALERCVGMYAIAVWDHTTRQLCLARDRFGEKPLYWCQTPHGLVFGSELKALITSGWPELTISLDAVAALLRHNNVPGASSIFEGVHKLEPGNVLVLNAPDAAAAPHAYWSVTKAWQRGLADPFLGSDEDAVSRLEGELKRVLHDQIQTDVPLGAFLSGGVDSSTVVALMQSLSSQKIRTFTVGFPVQGYNEAEAAKAVARHLGTDHTELYLSPGDALRVIEKLPTMYCEPFADSSQIPTHLVSTMARQHVTVALSGDGGDEVFGGYNRYLFGLHMLHRISAWPRPLRHAAADLIDSLSPGTWDAIGRRFGGLLQANARFADLGDKLGKVGRALRADDEDQLYESLISQWPQPALAVPGATEAMPVPSWQGLGLKALDPVERMMVRDATGYLPDDILTKVDRASMAVSLEARAPYLDHRLYEFAARLPMRMKIRDGCTKWLLRQVLQRYVPRELIERPKAGFGIPIDCWLRAELRDWAEALLSPQALARSAVFDADVVRRAWHLHLSGRANLQHRLWCVLMFQAWHQHWIEGQARMRPSNG